MLAAVATSLRLKRKTNIKLIIPEIVIALAGTLVLVLIFAIALGITPSKDNMYESLEDPSKVGSWQLQL